jgi:PAS domain S-box-containing protein
VAGDTTNLVAVLQSGTADLLVLDAAQDGIDVSAVLGHLQAATLDTPVLLLARPGGEDLAIQAGRFAVCDCVVKTADYLLQVLPAIGQLRARHDLVALFRTNRQSQDRLRTILEFQPAVTSVISPDGIITAMNQAGLTLLGAARDQVVGRSFTSLLPDDARHDAGAFLRRVCQGEAGDFDHVVLREGGQPLAVRTRAVPFRNGDTVVALATLQERVAASPETNAEFDALSAAALADALGEIESLRGQRDLWATQREAYEARAREAAAHADAVIQQAQSDAATLVRERTEWALERQQHAQRQREAEQTAADLLQATAALQHVHAELAQAQAALEPLRHAQEAFDTLRADFTPLRTELDTLRAERGQWIAEHAAWTAEREQWLAERQQLEARLRDAGQSESLRKQLEDERDSLTRVLHAVTGRCELLEADARRADAAAQEAIERQRQDAAALAQLDAERGTLAQALESLQAQLFEATSALASERSAWAQERDTTAWQHQQALDAARGALDQERQDFSARQFDAQQALDAERQRTAALLLDLQEARTRAGELAALQQTADMDHAAVLKLRDDLLRFMADADSQCRTIIEHHEARQGSSAVLGNQSFT